MHKNTWVPLLVVLGISSTCAGTSTARSTPAMLGNTLTHEIQCPKVDFDTGQVTNVCSDFLLLWTVGLPLDSNGTHSGTITIKVPDINSSFCRVSAFGRNTAGASQTGFLTAPAPNVFVDLNWSVTVPASGYLVVQCSLGPNAIISKIDHSPN